MGLGLLVAASTAADKVQPEEESWNLILDERYKGRIGFFSDGVAIIKVGGLINGVADPNKMTQDEIDAAKETMIRAKPNIRTFWTSQTDAIKEIVAGNLDITYGWPDAFFSIRSGLPEDANVVYMQPKEGRLAWVCALRAAQGVAASRARARDDEVHPRREERGRR